MFRVWMQSSLDFIIVCLPVPPQCIHSHLIPHQRNRGKEDPREQSLPFFWGSDGGDKMEKMSIQQDKIKMEIFCFSLSISVSGYHFSFPCVAMNPSFFFFFLATWPAKIKPPLPAFCEARCESNKFWAMRYKQKQCLQILESIF